MFKIVKTATLDDLQSRVESLEAQIEFEKTRYENLSSEATELGSRLLAEEKEKAAVQAKLRETEDVVLRLNGRSDEIRVTLKLSKDLEVVTPVIAYSADTFEALFQSGRLNDAQNTPQAIQLALLMIAEEALQQLVDEFAPEVVGD